MSEIKPYIDNILNDNSNTAALKQAPKQPYSYQAFVAIDLAKHIVTLFKLTIAKQKSRADLKALNNHQLKDIGLTRKEADREAAKPFWQ